MTTRTEVLVSFAQIVELYGVTAGRVRAWIAAGLIKPVLRQGKGRDGAMYFERGAVQGLVFGSCPVCGNGFKRNSIKQGFCSRLCRDRSLRLHKRSGAATERLING